MPRVTLRHRLLAAAIAVLTTSAAVVTAAVLSHREDPELGVGFILVSVVAALAFGVVGLVLVSERPSNPLGPLLGVAGVALLLEFVSRELAHPSLAATGAGPVGARALVWAGLVLDPLFFPVPIALALLLFPDGRLPSRRWRPVVLLGLVATVARVVLIAVTPGPLSVESYGW